MSREILKVQAADFSDTAMGNLLRLITGNKAGVQDLECLFFEWQCQTDSLCMIIYDHAWSLGFASDCSDCYLSLPAAETAVGIRWNVCCALLRAKLKTSEDIARCDQVRVPFLDFAPDFVEAIVNGEKKATTRCPGPKDTDHTSVPWTHFCHFLSRLLCCVSQVPSCHHLAFSETARDNNIAILIGKMINYEIPIDCHFNSH